MTTKNYTVIINSFFINVTVARNPFKKRLDRKPQETFEFEDLIPKPYRRDQPAQRLRPKGCGSKVARRRIFQIMSAGILSAFSGFH